MFIGIYARVTATSVVGMKSHRNKTWYGRGAKFIEKADYMMKSIKSFRNTKSVTVRSNLIFSSL